MHEHGEDSRVMSPRDESPETRVEHGRQLAMDSILQAACRGMTAESGETVASAPQAMMGSATEGSAKDSKAPESAAPSLSDIPRTSPYAPRES